MLLQLVTRIKDFYLHLRQEKKLLLWISGAGILSLLTAVVIISRQLFFQSDPEGITTNRMNTNLLSLSIFIKLLLAVAVLALCLYLLQSWRKGILGSSIKTVNIRETTRLSQHQSLHLIQVGERFLLIGATDQSMSLLAEIDAKSLPSPEPSNKNTDLTFTKFLGQAIQRRLGETRLKSISSSDIVQSGLDEDRKEV